ncbi:hypothetical protein SERLADRAFT_360180 [Serpula lacrymans var. lacrymans S7.9]|uniref:RINT-1 family protein n=1 Tax=Serpula lacrymans var. lacrymans (strain S7.9) TaxID=578457 RepID=F8NMR6_SERL9|nr:uncharacterized protein SERLADRAFT_360180 [Serpula lacrymans var. lacrymans S7.9]EGO27463.1 hypothetical protein SERLADRAFT_360180 [Serpula lacrymans var. lacrymans S7.9]
MKSYRSLVSFFRSVSTACGAHPPNAAEPNYRQPHLVTFLRNVCDATWTRLKEILSTKLIPASEAIGWPTSLQWSMASTDIRDSFERSFKELLVLQEIGESLHNEDHGLPSDTKPGLYSLQTLINPIVLRYRYHFEMTRATNRVDRPEWYLTYIFNLIHDHKPFMEDVIQPWLHASGKKWSQVEAWPSYALLLLPLIRRKLSDTVPSLLEHPSILAHTVDESVAFDLSIRNLGIIPASYTNQAAEKAVDWTVSSAILDRKEWFEAWIDCERKFTENRYHDIISAPDAWHITDDDYSTVEKASHVELRPTNSARQVKALVQGLTSRYSSLPGFTQRTRFLTSIQLPVIESYYTRISKSLDAFEVLSSVLGVSGLVPGALDSTGGNSGAREGEQQDSGLEGTQRLIKALVSARYIQDALEGWGEDIFFLELWEEICHRAQAKGDRHTTDDRKVEDETRLPEGTIFEELLVEYAMLVERAENMIERQICGEVEGAISAYVAALDVGPSVDLSSSSPVDYTAPSSGLHPALVLLSSHLTSLQQNLPMGTVTSLYRRIVNSIADYFWMKRIASRGRMRLSEAKVVKYECELWVTVCKSAMKASGGNAAAAAESGMGARWRVEGPWMKLVASGRVLAAEGDEWEGLVRAWRLGTDAAWEEGVRSVYGDGWDRRVGEGSAVVLGREEGGKVLRLRED